MRSLIALVVFALLSLQLTTAVASPHCGHAACGQARALEHGPSFGTTLGLVAAAGIDDNVVAIDLDCTHCHTPTFSATSHPGEALMPELVLTHVGTGLKVFPGLLSDRPERPQWLAPMRSGQDLHT